MPIFVYKCRKCKEEVEVYCPPDKQEPDTCDCGGELFKIPTLSSFNLVGQGWYKSGFKGK